MIFVRKMLYAGHDESLPTDGQRDSLLVTTTPQRCRVVRVRGEILQNNSPHFNCSKRTPAYRSLMLPGQPVSHSRTEAKGCACPPTCPCGRLAQHLQEFHLIVLMILHATEILLGWIYRNARDRKRVFRDHWAVQLARTLLVLSEDGLPALQSSAGEGGLRHTLSPVRHFPLTTARAHGQAFVERLCASEPIHDTSPDS